MLKKIASKLYRLFFNIATLMFPPKKKSILFESFNGKLPSDNPLAIYKAIIEKQPKNDFYYWGVKKSFLKEAQLKFPDLNFVVRFSFKWMLVATRANYWIFNARMPHWLKKNKKTIYIQTWHGTPLKKLGIDIDTVSMPGTDTEIYKKNFIAEATRWNYLVAPNEYSRKIFQTAFNFKNNFLNIGYPRNDEIIHYREDKEYQKNLRKKIIGKDTGRVILYAPTWRDDYYIGKGNYKFYMPFDLMKIINMISGDDTLIIRPHYLIGDSIDVSKYSHHVKVCTNQSINDLYLISDLLITDYSSVMFDFALLNRPMLFYPYDLEHYQEELRGFYFNYQDVPGPIAENEKEFYKYLDQFLHSGQFDSYKEKQKNFYKKFASWEKGTASKEIAELVLKEK